MQSPEVSWPFRRLKKPGLLQLLNPRARLRGADDRHHLAVVGHLEGLPRCNPAKNLAAVVAQFSVWDYRHVASVARWAAGSPDHEDDHRQQDNQVSKRSSPNVSRRRGCGQPLFNPCLNPADHIRGVGQTHLAQIPRRQRRRISVSTQQDVALLPTDSFRDTPLERGIQTPRQNRQIHDQSPGNLHRICPVSRCPYINEHRSPGLFSQGLARSQTPQISPGLRQQTHTSDWLIRHDGRLAVAGRKVVDAGIVTTLRLRQATH